MYYRLTYISTENKERQGDYVINGMRPLDIGQGASCGALLPESDMYEAQLFATILFKEEFDKWFLVRKTDCYKISVNGAELSIAQLLNNGDILSFADGTHESRFKFEVLNDDDFDPNSGYVYKKRKSNGIVMAVTIAISLVAVCVAAYSLWNKEADKDLRRYDLSSVTQSVYHITTDAVYLLCDSLVNGEIKQVIVDAIELDNVAAGTAFLTDDSLFVTARHCIEPWINDEKWDGISSKLKMSPELKLATYAETCNRLLGEKKYSLRSHCIISRDHERYEFYSTDFFMDQTRDLVIRLGSAGETIYLRTIIPIAQRRDMELGDFAYVKVDTMGCLSLAGWQDILSFSKPDYDHNIAVVGYPLTDNKTEGDAVPVFGNLMGMEFNSDRTNLSGCIQMSAPINRGNSGGPILARVGNKIKVVGIVSKADERANQGVFWAVPATEVVRMHGHGDNTEDDSMIFRR